MIFPASFVAFYLLLLMVLLAAAYQLYKRYKQMPEEFTATELAQQQARNATVQSSSNRSTTRQLITQSLMQAWRMGESPATTTTPTTTDTTDEEIETLRNQRVDLMKKSLQYKIIGEEVNNNTSCVNEHKMDIIEDDVEIGPYQKQQQQQSSSEDTSHKHFFEIPKECSICLDVYSHGEKVATPLLNGCTHAFHDECITLWLLQHDHCPLCRTKLLVLELPAQ